MSSMKILSLAINASGFTDVTPQIQPTLAQWAEEGLITGDALCCVTMASSGAGVLVADFNPAGVAFSSFLHVGDVSLKQDYSGLRDLFARTSEIFLLRGPTIVGNRRIHILTYTIRSTCDVAVALL